MKILSVVIPIFKVEKYIRQCLDSLVLSDSELMENLDVLCINDGTPDHSAEIAREYERKYPNTFRVTDKENGGHGSAWNRGLSEATGKYVAFLDSDDWYSTVNLTKLLLYLETVDVDAVMTKMETHVFENEQEVRTNVLCASKFASLEDQRIYDTKVFCFNRCDVVMFNFQHLLYKTDKLRSTGVKFMEHTSYDDDLVGLAGLLMMDEFAYLDMILYNYRFGREGQSIGGSYSLKRVNMYYQTAKQLYDFYEDYSKCHTLKENVDEYARKFVAHTTFCLFPHLTHLPYNQFEDMIKKIRLEFAIYPLFNEAIEKADSYYRLSPQALYKHDVKMRRRAELVDRFAQSALGVLLRKIKHLVK